MNEGETTTPERWGLEPLSETNPDREPSHDPGTYWRTGFSLPAVRAGYAYPREPVVADLSSSLANREHRLVVGRPGAGKSTVCKLVATRWQENRGRVYYVDAATSLGGPDPEAVAAAIPTDEGQALVVVEDALDPDRDEAFALVESVGDGVSVLLETRRATVENLAERLSADREDVVERVKRLRGEAVTDYELPGVDADECARVVEYYEDLTGTEVLRSPEEIYREVRSARSVGGDEMLHLCYVLCAGDGTTGLERAVERAYERSGGTGTDVVGQVALAANVCNAAALPVRDELLHTLAADHAAIDRAIATLVDDLLFEREDGPGYRTNHQLWSGLYVKHLVTEADPERGERRLAEAINGLFRIADADERREIDAWLSSGDGREDERGPQDGGPERLVGERPGDSSLEGVLPAANLVERIGEFGVRWPVLAPAFGTSGEDDPIDLPDRCSRTTESEFLTYRGRMHRLAGDLERARGEFERALERVEAGDLPAELVTKTRTRYHNDVGELDREGGDLDAAADNFRRALDAARSVQYWRGEARSLGNLGDVARRRGNLETATERCERSLDHYRSVGDDQAVASAYRRLGLLQYRLGDPDGAEDAYEKALEIYRQLGNRQGEAACLTNIGVVHHVLEEYETARQYHEESLAVSQRVGELMGVAKSRNNLGIVARQRDDLERAAEQFRESLEIKREVGDRGAIANSLGNLGVVARQRENYEAAERYHRESLDIYREIGQANETARAHLNLGNVSKQTGRPAEAREQFRAALDGYDDVGHDPGVGTCYQELGKLDREEGNPETALEHYCRAVELFAAVDDEDAVAAAAVVVELAEELDATDRLEAVCEQVAPLLSEASSEDVEKLRPYCDIEE